MKRSTKIRSITTQGPPCFSIALFYRVALPLSRQTLAAEASQVTGGQQPPGPPHGGRPGLCQRVAEPVPASPIDHLADRRSSR
jgi:hypothetical protein